MAIAFECKHCKAPLELDDGFQGGIARCSGCGALLQVPRGSGESLARPARPARPAAPPTGPGTRMAQSSGDSLNGAAGITTDIGLSDSRSRTLAEGTGSGLPSPRPVPHAPNRRHPHKTSSHGQKTPAPPPPPAPAALAPSERLLPDTLAPIREKSNHRLLLMSLFALIVMIASLVAAVYLFHPS